ncbi:MAG: holo-ACP synthase [Steroidobacteraceae bacterium]
MIHGIGTDIVKLARFESMYQRHGERLVKHLLLPAELELFATSKSPARFLAKHWAAKEAVVKALGTGFAGGIWIRDVGYLSNKAGKPEIIWSEQGREVCRELHVGEGHLTLSDEEGLIVAMVVLMKAAT